MSGFKALVGETHLAGLLTHSGEAFQQHIVLLGFFHAKGRGLRIRFRPLQVRGEPGELLLAPSLDAERFLYSGRSRVALLLQDSTLFIQRLNTGRNRFKLLRCRTGFRNPLLRLGRPGAQLFKKQRLRLRALLIALQFLQRFAERVVISLDRRELRLKLPRLPGEIKSLTVFRKTLVGLTGIFQRLIRLLVLMREIGLLMKPAERLIKPRGFLFGDLLAFFKPGETHTQSLQILGAEKPDPLHLSLGFLKRLLAGTLFGVHLAGDVFINFSSRDSLKNHRPVIALRPQELSEAPLGKKHAAEELLEPETDRFRGLFPPLIELIRARHPLAIHQFSELACFLERAFLGRTRHAVAGFPKPAAGFKHSLSPADPGALRHIGAVIRFLLLSGRPVTLLTRGFAVERERHSVKNRGLPCTGSSGDQKYSILIGRHREVDLPLPGK